MNSQRIQKALSAFQSLAEPQVVLEKSISAEPPASRACRPWERSDLLRRLQTYRSAAWFAKSAAASPVHCAIRGWICSGLDQLSCEFCSATVSHSVAPNTPPAAAHKGAEQFAQSLIDGHEPECPWRSSACEASLAQFPATTSTSLSEAFGARCAELQKLEVLPPIAQAAYERVAEAAKDHLGAFLLRDTEASGQHSDGEAAGAHHHLIAGAAHKAAEPAFTARARFIALCGWDVKVLGLDTDERRPESLPPSGAALSCSMCGAKAGLWSYFAGCNPATPAAQSAEQTAAHPRMGNGAAASPHPSAGPHGVMAFGGANQSIFGSQSLPVFGLAAMRGNSVAEGELHGSDMGQEASAINTQFHAAAEDRLPAANASEPREWVAAEALDPLAAHRAFCPWVAQQPGPGSNPAVSRVGWRCCVDALMEQPQADRDIDMLDDASETRAESRWDPAQRLRSVLRNV